MGVKFNIGDKGSKSEGLRGENPYYPERFLKIILILNNKRW